MVWEALIKTSELFIIWFFHELDYGYTSWPSPFENQCQATHEEYFMNIKHMLTPYC